MNAFYDVAVDALLSGTLDLLHDDIVIGAYDVRYFAPTWANVSELYAPIAGVPYETLTGRSIAQRWLSADDVTFDAIPEVVLRSLSAHRVGDGMLVFYIDTRPDRMALDLTGNGGAMIMRWWQGRVIGL